MSAIDDLVNELSRLPTIGRKSALRLVVEDGPGIDRALHRLRLGVDSISYHRHVAPQLFQELDDLRRLLLGVEVDLELERGTLLGVELLSVLRRAG